MHVELMREAARDFPDIAKPMSCVSIRIWHCKYRTHAPIGDLANLQGLEVASYPDTDLRPIGKLVHLKYVHIMHMPKVTSLAPLAALRRLEVLRLATLPSWDSSYRRLEVDSLEPLSHLPLLRHVELFGVVPPDRSLESLERCESLESVRVSKYAKNESERFAAASGCTDAFAPRPAF